MPCRWRATFPFRGRSLEPVRAALLLIDIQNGEYSPQKVRDEPDYACFWERMAGTVIPNGKRLLAACRGAGVEVLFTTVESYTLDDRGRSLDYKVSGIFLAKGSGEAQVADELKPLPNEIVIPKMSPSVFVSTNIAWVPGNLGIEYLIVMGILTDQCVASAAGDACDEGFLVTLIDDACATQTRERHDATLRAIKGYCRQRTTEQVLAELGGWKQRAAE
ncbi:MAG: cysteine hydrolase family protein [Dongiaceae bacterium]